MIAPRPRTVVPFDEQIAAIEIEAARLRDLAADHGVGACVAANALRRAAALASAIDTLKWAQAFGLGRPIGERT